MFKCAGPYIIIYQGLIIYKSIRSTREAKRSEKRAIKSQQLIRSEGHP